MKNKKWSKPYIAQHLDLIIANEEYQSDKLSHFCAHSPLYLEVGTGKGDFIFKMAKQNCNGHFLGVEKSTTCIAITLKKIVTESLKNVMLIDDDISNVFLNLADHSIDIIFLNFSDPWPKKRHCKRRLTSENFLQQYQRLLKENGKIIMKTDNLELFEYSLETLQKNGFVLSSVDYDYNGNETFDAQTEYETNFRSQNIPIKRLIAKVGTKNGIK